MCPENLSPADYLLQERQLNICLDLEFIENRLRVLVDPPSQAAYDSPEMVKRTIQYLQEAFPDKELLSLYAWGSRWFGEADPTSDWDFCAVVDGYQQPDVGNVYEFGPDIDVAVYSPESWQKHLNDHTLWAVPFMYHPPEAIFVNRRQWHFELRVQKLRRSAMKNLKKNLNQAKGLWRDGEIRKSKKRVRYSVRHADFACQLVAHNQITDRSACNQLGEQMLAGRFQSWSQFCQLWEPIYEERVAFLAKLTRSYREVENGPGLPILKFIDKFGLNNLTRNLSIVQYYEDSKVALLLTPEILLQRDLADDWESPRDSITVQQAHGLVISAVSHQILCFPPSRAAYSLNEFEPADQYWISALRSGHLLNLYSDASSTLARKGWSVASRTSPIGTDNLGEESSRKVFWDLFAELEYQLPQDLTLTYSFLLLHPRYPRLSVVEAPRLLFLSARNNQTGETSDRATVARLHSWDFEPEHEGPMPDPSVPSGLSPLSTAGWLVRKFDQVALRVYHPAFEKLRSLQRAPREEVEALVLFIAVESLGCSPAEVRAFPVRPHAELFASMHGALLELCSEVDHVWELVRGTPRPQMASQLKKFQARVDIAFVFLLGSSHFLPFVDDYRQLSNCKEVFLRHWDRKTIHRYLGNWWRQRKRNRPRKVG